MNLRQRGFTLIELIVVLAIIGILVGLLTSALPLVEEASNRSVCVQNMRQIGLALHQYHDVYGALPNEKPNDRSSLIFVALLPYLERTQYDLDDPAPVTEYICPSRHRSPDRAKTDYAAARHSSFSVVTRWSGNVMISILESTIRQHSVLGGSCTGIRDCPLNPFPNLSIPMIAERDGTSATLMLGHKHLRANQMEIDIGGSQVGDQGWTIPYGAGSDSDSRQLDHQRLVLIAPLGDWQPHGFSCWGFGSPHRNGAPVMATDGSVRLYSLYGPDNASAGMVAVGPYPGGRQFTPWEYLWSWNDGEMDRVED